MYTVGMPVLYSRAGVCRVESIGVPAFQKEGGRVCYKLRSVFSNSNELAYVPVETAASLRPLISAEEAERYLAALPQMKPPPFPGKAGELSEHYRMLLGSSDAEDYLLLIKEIHGKRQQLEGRGKKLGQVDARYLKIAERLICEEFAAAMGTSPDAARERLYAALGQET